jgi:hypothetical protein
MVGWHCANWDHIPTIRTLIIRAENRSSPSILFPVSELTLKGKTIGFWAKKPLEFSFYSLYDPCTKSFRNILQGKKWRNAERPGKLIKHRQTFATSASSKSGEIGEV